MFDAPILIALASTGYFLNLFNLLPVGFLDGGGSLHCRAGSGCQDRRCFSGLMEISQFIVG
jgi:hypothetical protein